MAAKGKDPFPPKHGRFFPLEVKVAVAKAHVEQGALAEELCKAYGVSKSRVYKWSDIYRARGEKGLATMHGTPKPREAKPGQEKVAEEILKTKKRFSWFGIPRIVQWIRRAKLLPVTAHQVKKTLKEANLVPKRPKRRRRAEMVRRFERSEPNSMWQVDITMFSIARGQRVYLIGFIDDHSRYIVGWGLHAAQGTAQVLEVLRNAIGQYGAPREILSDQGRQFYAWRGKCTFQKELAREGIQHVVSRSHHPQTLGKIEAFWKHLKEEFLDRVVSGSINDLRERLRLWIDSFYNFQRPHQGIGGLVPADRFFKVADQVRQTIEKGVKENAERLALGKEPVKPFYMVGRMGDKDVVIRQEGSEVTVNVGNQELEKIRLSEENDETKEPESGEARAGGGPAGEGPGAGGAAGAFGGEDDQPDLPGDRVETGPVLQARVADAQGDGDGGAVESGGRQGGQDEHAGGLGKLAGAKPEAPAGEPEDAVASEADEEAVQNGPERPKTGPGPAPDDASNGPEGGPAAGSGE
jgi:transposase InsO family protein